MPLVGRLSHLDTVVDSWGSADAFERLITDFDAHDTSLFLVYQIVSCPKNPSVSLSSEMSHRMLPGHHPHDRR